MITDQPAYILGEFLVEPTQNRISILGDVRTLEPKTMDVLVYLIENKNRIVSADELLEKLWPGRIVEESTIHRRINQLRNALDDSAKHPRYIKNVVKRGYQVIAKASIPLDSDEHVAAITTSPPPRPPQQIILGAATAAILVLLGGYFLMRDDSEVMPALSDLTPAIAVLPFTNMSDSAENAFFADGIHEDLLTTLSGIENLAVISRTSVMRYADHVTSVRQIGEELGVNYVVEGSVRRQNQQVRISVQLIDAQNDRHLWAMTYDRGLSDTFALQSEITEQIAAQLSLKLLNKEVLAYDTEVNDVLYKARELMRERTAESLASALTSLRMARAGNPENAQIHSAIGESLYLLSRESESWQEVRDETLSSLELALRLDPDLASARLALARVQVWWLRDIPAADQNYQTVIRAEPNNADALMKYGEFLANSRAMRDVGMPHLRRAVELNPYSGEAWALLASNLMRSGNFVESQAVLSAGFEHIPEDYYLLRYQMEHFLYSGDRIEGMKHLLDLIQRDPASLPNIALFTDLLRRLEFYAEAQLWLDEMYRINPEHTNTYDSEVNQLLYLQDWEGLAGVNARWEPILADYVTLPARNWRLWSMQAEADRLWRVDKNPEAQQIYSEIAAILTNMNIPYRMGLAVDIVGSDRLEQGNMLAHALIRIERIDEAHQLLTSITRNTGSNATFEINKALAWAMLGDTDEAIAAFASAITGSSANEPSIGIFAPGATERLISLFMDPYTDWLNDINRNPAITELHQQFLGTRQEMQERVRAEIPETFNPAAFLQSARLQ